MTGFRAGHHRVSSHRGRRFYGGSYFSLRRWDPSRFHTILDGGVGLYKGTGKRAKGIARAQRSRRDLETEQLGVSEMGRRRARDPGVLDAADRRHGGFGTAEVFVSTRARSMLVPARATSLRRDLTIHIAQSCGRSHDHRRRFHRYCVDESFEIPHFEKLLRQTRKCSCCFPRSLCIEQYDGEFRRNRRPARGTANSSWNITK